MANPEIKEIVKAIKELTSELKRIRKGMEGLRNERKQIMEVDIESDEG